MPLRSGGFLAAALATTALSGVLSGCASHGWSSGVALRQSPGAPGVIRIEIDGELFAQYHYQGASRPYLFPVLTADGALVARRWPLQESTDEEQDHPHHKSLWYAHGDVNGVDFWSESSEAGKTVHVEFLEKRSGRDRAILATRNDLIAKDGKRVATEDYVLTIHRTGDVRILDFDVTLHASDGDLTLGDTKEGSMAIRLAETMRLKPNEHNRGKPTGHIVNSEGLRDGNTWGKRAAWVDYYGPVGDQTVGVAIFDHPSNPRHPTWWHVRDYGLFAANPFGIHDFERKPAGAGDMKIPAGDKVTFRYRFILHAGDEVTGQIAERYQAYAE